MRLVEKFRENKQNTIQSQKKAEEYIRREYNVRGHREASKAPLYFAAQKGYINIVKLLINAGVDLWAIAYHGIALYYAAIGEYKDMFQFLWDAGINAHRKNSFEAAAFLSTVNALEKNSYYFLQGTTNAMQEEGTKHDS